MAHLLDKSEARIFKSYQAAKNKYDAQHSALMALVEKRGNAGFYEKAMHRNVSKPPPVHVAPAQEVPMLPVRGRLPAPRRRRTAAEIAEDETRKQHEKEEKKAEKQKTQVNLEAMQKEDKASKKLNKAMKKQEAVAPPPAAAAAAPKAKNAAKSAIMKAAAGYRAQGIDARAALSRAYAEAKK